MERLGAYQVERELARGGMGVVYLARDPRAGGAPRAIKVMLPGVDVARRRRFVREAQALTRLGDPRVIAVHEVGEERGLPFLVMDYVEGEPLAQRLARRGPWPEAEAAALVAELAEAVQHCHERGVLHRDLKPDNVLLRPDGSPVLVDFGLTRDVAPDGQTRLTRTGALLGTPGYWAPEQVRGEAAAIGPATDVFGLGALLFALLTGVPPTQCATLMQAVAELEAPPRPPSQLRPGLAPALDAVCLRALAREPGERFPDAAALAAALRALPAPRAQRPGVPVGWLPALGAVGVLLLGGVALLAARRPERDPRPESSPAPEPVEGSSAAPSPAASSAEQARAALALGRSALEAGDVRAARQSFEEATGLDPSLAEAWRELAELHRRADALPSARAALEQATRAAPGDPGGWVALAQVHEALDELPAAEAAYGRALTLDLRQVEALSGRGRLRLRAKRPAEALPDLQAALEQAPDRDDLRLAVGEALLALNRAPEAEDLGRQVLERGPDPAATLLVGRCLMAADFTRAAEVLQLYDAALARTPEHAELLSVRGGLRVALQRPGGRADLERAVTLDPDSAYAWSNLITARSLAGDLLAAEEANSRVVALQPQDDGPLRQRAMLRERIGDPEGALADLEALVALRPDAADLWSWLARLRGEQHRARPALEAWDRALALKPGDPDLLVGRGRALFALGRREEGLATLERALAAAPGGSRAWFRATRAEGLWKMGRVAEAEPELRAALAERPGGAIALLLAELLLRDTPSLPARPEAALAVLEAELARLPGGAGVDLLHARAAALGRLGRWAEAVAALQELTGSNPQHAPTWQELARAQSQAGDAAGAVASASRAVALRPKDPDPLVLRAEVRRLGGDLAGAEADCQAALALRSSPLTWDALAKVREARGDAAGAAEARRRAGSLTMEGR